jgi:hypothetical protein
MTDVASLNTYQFLKVKRRHFFMVDRSTSTSAWTTNRIVALVIGIVFLIVGVLGLIFDTNSGSVFGFDVDLIHNLVHVLTGILGLAAAFSGWSRRFNQTFGVIYLLIGLAGLVPALYFSQRLLGLMHVNAADNVLHLVVGLGAAVVGFFVNDSVTRGATASGRREDPMLRP